MSESRSGEHQELEERFQAVVSERYGVSGAPTAELAISNATAAAHVEGVWTPERVSQETGDRAPCSDVWQLGPA